MVYKKVLPILLLTLIFVGAPPAETAFARGSGGGYRSSHISHSSHSTHNRSISTSTSRSSPSSKISTHRSTYAAAIPRDSPGRIKRSEKAKHNFQRSNPCPSTGRTTGSCPGYVIDHIKPLKHGGSDSPSNMQWQTKEAAKAKDKWE